VPPASGSEEALEFERLADHGYFILMADVSRWPVQKEKNDCGLPSKEGGCQAGGNKFDSFKHPIIGHLDFKKDWNKLCTSTQLT
jgi:hypothetical protein